MSSMQELDARIGVLAAEAKASIKVRILTRLKLITLSLNGKRESVILQVPSLPNMGFIESTSFPAKSFPMVESFAAMKFGDRKSDVEAKIIKIQPMRLGQVDEPSKAGRNRIVHQMRNVGSTPTIGIKQAKKMLNNLLNSFQHAISTPEILHTPEDKAIMTLVFVTIFISLFACFLIMVGIYTAFQKLKSFMKSKLQ